MSAVARIGHALDERLALRGPLRRVARRIFPTHWSFLLGEVSLFSFVALVASGVYLALFYRASVAPVVYHGAYAPLAGRELADAYASVLDLSVAVPFGLVVRRFHHFAAHLFIASLLLHAARVYFTGAFRRPRELTWWIGLGLFGLALVSGFSGYCLPFDMRGGTALRMSMTTLESVPWIGPWLATLVFGAPFPGPFIVGRLMIAHVFVLPVAIALFIGAHLALVVRQTHTDYPGPGRDARHEVGARLWPEQTARSVALFFFVLGITALLASLFPVEAVQAYGPFQVGTSYTPLSPDWFLMWIEGAYRLVPRQLDFHLLGASFTNPFYGAVLLPLFVFACCALYPLVDRRVYRDVTDAGDPHALEPWRGRPLRTAVGVSGVGFLVMLSCGALDVGMASAVGLTIGTVRLVWGILTLAVPAALFVVVLLVLRRRVRQPPSAASSASAKSVGVA